MGEALDGHQHENAVKVLGHFAHLLQKLFDCEVIDGQGGHSNIVVSRDKRCCLLRCRLDSATDRRIDGNARGPIQKGSFLRVKGGKASENP